MFIPFDILTDFEADQGRGDVKGVDGDDFGGLLIKRTQRVERKEEHRREGGR